MAPALALLLAAGGTVLGLHEQLRLRERFSPLWVSAIHDIAYGPHADNRLDILQRRWGRRSADRPVVVVFHGGGWRTGSRASMLVRVCHRYLEHGFLVINAEYRKGSIVAAVQDAETVLRWVSRHAVEYRADEKRIVVTGESAGAHLALMAVFRSGVPAAAIINFYGPADLSELLDRPAIRAVLPPDSHAAARALSPVTHVRKGLPPILSIHGTADDVIPRRQSALLTRAVTAAGGQAVEFVIEGAGHGGLSREQQHTAYGAIFEFLRVHAITSGPPSANPR